MTETIRRVAGVTAPALILAAATGCSAPEPEQGAMLVVHGSAPAIGERLVSLPRPPALAASDTAEAAKAGLNAVRTDWQKLYRRTDASLVSVDALPFISRTREGQSFLEAEAPRALARGRPADRCPVTVASDPAPAVTLDALVQDTLARCLAALRPAYPDCGCEVLAVDDFLTVPREEVSYSSGLAARMHVPALGIDTLLVADDVEGETLIRGPAGPVARLERLDGGRVRVVLGTRSFEGESRAVGYRRGRVAERIYAADAAGNRMSLLIGFSPKELAEGAAAWLAWPGGS